MKDSKLGIHSIRDIVGTVSLLSGVRNGHVVKKDKKKGWVLGFRRDSIGFIVSQKATKNCITENKDLQLALQVYISGGNI